LIVTEKLPDTCGIYKITNINNGKTYVGKTVNFRRRRNDYVSAFNKQNMKKINEYFLNALNKHGIENFIFEIVEECEVEETAERELFWIKKLKTTNQEKGYNLRMDSSTGMMVHKKTRDKIGRRIKQEFKNGIRSPEKVSKFFKEFWKNKDNVDRMTESLRETRSSFFVQKRRDGTVVNVWRNIHQLLGCNPHYKWQNIYAACNGNKKTHWGYVWEKRKEIPKEYEKYLRNDEYEGFVRYKDGERIYKNRKTKVYVVTDKDGNTRVLDWKNFKSEFPGGCSKFSKKKSDRIEIKGSIIKRFYTQEYEEQQ
jgi:group I intron endonuclease